MAEKTLVVTLHRIGPAAFEAASESGASLIVDGDPSIGGQDRGMRPMEALLAAIASCASMDVVAILTKQKEPLADLEVRVTGTRVDATPAPYRRIELAFIAHGGVDPHKLSRAVTLSVEKYCSVAESLDPAIEIAHSAQAI
ncbi:MAG: OsmC family protein [Sandaracinaceae bacterium]|nr:OsmC family protein [Sandaracinaceae bacterium]